MGMLSIWARNWIRGKAVKCRRIGNRATLKLGKGPNECKALVFEQRSDVVSSGPSVLHRSSLYVLTFKRHGRELTRLMGLLFKKGKIYWACGNSPNLTLGPAIEILIPSGNFLGI
ncbi:hypothetical protein M0R45_013590 [Rubus argutus]|uniref:Uncharacterized protein n=1 Tax=Rubus argutus TaxID=59490 RepID=A0AAW1XKY9_RUBAR